MCVTMEMEPTVCRRSVRTSRRRSSLSRVPVFLVADGFAETLAGMKIDSFEAVFSLEQGKDLAKKSLGRHRKRIELEAVLPGMDRPVKLYLKRYDHPPILKQIGNWFAHKRRVTFGGIEHETAVTLAARGVATPRTIAWGRHWGRLFEKRSFLMTQEVTDSQSLERRLPDCFHDPSSLAKRREFIRSLASFVQRFHETGYRHRDLYLSHIFCSTEGQFCLIDLARAFKPLLAQRFRVKDLAQLHYSAPRAFFTQTDRLRFFLAYRNRARLTRADKSFVTAIIKKARRMARHNHKHGVSVPFLDRDGARR